MNILELADELESIGTSEQTMCKAATMLRILEGQLAFRIDAVTKYQAWVEAQQAEIKRLTQENCDLWEQLNDGKASEK